MRTLDTALFFAINRGMSNALFDVLMPALSASGYLLFLPYVAYVVWRAGAAGGRVAFRSAMIMAVVAACAFFIADWASGLLKEAIGRTRPCHVLEGVRLLTKCSKSYAMPSGHATTSFAAAVPLFYIPRGYVPLLWRLYPLGLAAAVACSRVYVGVHYPSDVAVGALLGSFVALLLVGACHKMGRYGGRHLGRDGAHAG